MKINSVNILSFGKLKNTKIDFSDGLNIVYGDNEAGKTHIAEFIKLMFYGNGRSGQGVNNTRKKYKPWSDGKMGGSIDFTHENRRYRLEREFKASNSSDSVILHDLDAGTSLTLSGSDSIGAKFFGISLSAFEQSVFIDNSVVFSGKGDDGELNMKLANLVNSADEDISFDKIVKSITDARETLISKNTKKGPIPELEAKLSFLADGKQKSAEIYRLAQEKSENLSALEAELLSETEKKTAAFEKLRQYNNFTLKKQLTDFKAAVEEYEAAEKQLSFAGQTINSEYKSSLEEKLNLLKANASLAEQKLAECERDTDELAEVAAALPAGEGLIPALQERKQALKLKLQSFEKEMAELTAKAELLKAQKSAAKGKPNLTLLIIGAVILTVGVVAGIFYPYLFAFAAVGIINLALGLALKQKPDSAAADKALAEITEKVTASEKEKEALLTEIDNTDKQINDCIVKTNLSSSLLETKKEEAMKKRSEAITLNGEVDKQKSELFGIISSFKPVYDILTAEAAIKEMGALLEKLSAAKIKADAAVAHTGCRSTAEALEKLNTLPDVPEITETRAELDEQFRKIQERCSLLEKQVSGLEAEIKATTIGVRTPAEFEREASEAKEKLNSMRAFLSSADIALEVLGDAYALQRRSWGSALENKVLSIFSALTGGQYTGLSVSKDFELTVKKENDITSHSAEYLSRGAMHQAYFALRLALSEFLCVDSGSLPVILDDVFSQYDAKRTEKGFEFLSQYSTEHQVIFFTCHKELLSLANGNLIELSNSTDR